MIGVTGPTTGQRYAWIEEAFARRVIALLDSRNLKSVAEVIAALNGMAFNSAGWTTLKKILAELVAGSIAFPNDLDASGTCLLPGVTDATVGTRDVSSTVT